MKNEFQKKYLPTSYVFDESVKHYPSDRLPGSSPLLMESDFHIFALPCALSHHYSHFSSLTICAFSNTNISLTVFQFYFVNADMVARYQGGILTGAPA